MLDEATGSWGIRVNRVELKSVEPPRTVQEAMEKQMRAERDRRAAILTAEGVKQSQILTAEGEKQSAVLTAEGAAHGGDPRAEGEAKAIETVFRRHPRRRARPGSCSRYQYLQMLPQLAQGDANKIFVIPSEFTQALAERGRALRRPERPGAAPRRESPVAAEAERQARPPTPRRPREAAREAAAAGRARDARRRRAAAPRARSGRRPGPDAGDPPARHAPPLGRHRLDPVGGVQRRRPCRTRRTSGS